MGFRFRKSINLGAGFRVNFSKSGVGYSWGTKGFRLTKTAKGKRRANFSIPGTGLSYTTDLGGGSNGRKDKSMRKTATKHNKRSAASASRKAKKKKFDKRLFFAKTLFFAAVILFFMLNSALTDAFREKVSIKMTEEARVTYERQCEEAYTDMLGQYENDMVVYANDMQEYERASAEYAAQVEANQQAVTVYDEEYSVRMSDYSAALEVYETDLASYNSAYEKEYAKAQEAIFREGIPFKIEVDLDTVEWQEIGSEFSYYYSIDDTECGGRFDENICSVKLNSSLQFYSKIVEHDNTPDEGTARSSHFVKLEDLETGITHTQTVRVRENRGQNSGNTCVYEVTYILTPTEYTVNVDPSVLPAKPMPPEEPKYEPPKPSMEEPIPPIEPIYPEKDDIDIPKPDYSKTASDAEVYSHNTAARVLHIALVVVAFAVSTYLLIRIFIVKRIIKKENAAASSNITHSL